MIDDALGQLLDRRVQGELSAPVERGTIEAWCAVFGNEWPECVGDVAPSVMFTTFVRPPLPPAPGEAAPPRTAQEPVSFAWTEAFNVTAESIRREAAANHVWAGAHHHTEAAQKAGLADIILDTSSQVARLAGAAQRHRSTERITGINLAMKRPILPGATVTLGGVETDRTTIVSAVVDGHETSRVIVTFGG
jgi:hypothetical protein